MYKTESLHNLQGSAGGRYLSLATMYFTAPSSSSLIAYIVIILYISETSNGVNNTYEEIMLLPPKQFRDAPISVSQKIHEEEEEEVGAVDNILYHIYESPKRSTSHLISQLKKDGNTENVEGSNFLFRLITSAITFLFF